MLLIFEKNIKIYKKNKNKNEKCEKYSKKYVK